MSLFPCFISSKKQCKQVAYVNSMWTKNFTSFWCHSRARKWKLLKEYKKGRITFLLITLNTFKRFMILLSAWQKVSDFPTFFCHRVLTAFNGALLFEIWVWLRISLSFEPSLTREALAWLNLTIISLNWRLLDLNGQNYGQLDLA